MSSTRRQRELAEEGTGNERQRGTAGSWTGPAARGNRAPAGKASGTTAPARRPPARRPPARRAPVTRQAPGARPLPGQPAAARRARRSAGAHRLPGRSGAADSGPGSGRSRARGLRRRSGRAARTQQPGPYQGGPQHTGPQQPGPYQGGPQHTGPQQPGPTKVVRSSGAPVRRAAAAAPVRRAAVRGARSSRAATRGGRSTPGRSTPGRSRRRTRGCSLSGVRRTAAAGAAEAGPAVARGRHARARSRGGRRFGCLGHRSACGQRFAALTAPVGSGGRGGEGLARAGEREHGARVRGCEGGRDRDRADLRR